MLHTFVWLAVFLGLALTLAAVTQFEDTAFLVRVIWECIAAVLLAVYWRRISTLVSQALDFDKEPGPKVPGNSRGLSLKTKPFYSWAPVMVWIVGVLSLTLCLTDLLIERRIAPDWRHQIEVNAGLTYLASGLLIWEVLRAVRGVVDAQQVPSQPKNRS